MIRVVTWNIELGRNLDQAAAELTEHPDLAGADLILLQEMDPVGAARIADGLGMAHHYSAPARHPKTGSPFGNAVLSPWPLHRPRQFPLPHTAPIQGQPRAATAATIHIGDVVVDAYSVHLESVLLDVNRRVDQMASVASAIASPGEQLSIVGGDFNTASARSRRRIVRPLLAAGMVAASASTQETFRRLALPFTLDHLFISRGIRTRSSGVAAEATASDHFPVWAVLDTED